MLDITIKSTSEALVDKIANKSLQKQTVAMVNAVKAGKKCGWQFASACHAIKLLYTGKVANDITEQFPTIKEYAAFVGVDSSAIHNNARAYQFMMDNGQVPMVTKKGNKNPTVNFDGFSLNVGQAEQLSRFTEEQLVNVKALAESQGFTLSDISVGKLKVFKRCGKFVEEVAPTLDTKEEPKAKEEPYIDPKSITTEQRLAIIDEIIDNMLQYNITIKDITTREQQRGKQV